MINWRNYKKEKPHLAEAGLEDDSDVCFVAFRNGNDVWVHPYATEYLGEGLGFTCVDEKDEYEPNHEIVAWCLAKEVEKILTKSVRKIFKSKKMKEVVN